jgi:hypothetical protein
MQPFVKKVAFVKEAACFWLKGRILEFFSHYIGKGGLLQPVTTFTLILLIDGGRKS